MQISRTFSVCTFSWNELSEVQLACRITHSFIVAGLLVDPDDRVYPRASSRVGTKYQAFVVKWDGPGQVLATSNIFDDPHSSAMRGRSRRGGRGGRPSNRLKVPEGKSIVCRWKGGIYKRTGTDLTFHFASWDC